MDTSSLSRTELLQVADAVAREKSIERDEVLEAMEQAISKAGRAKYGHEHDIRAEIDRTSGEVQLRRFREVTDEVEDEITQISITDAKLSKPDIEPGEFVIEELPPIDLGRIAAQMAKQVIVQKVREAERKRQFEEYKDSTGSLNVTSSATSPSTWAAPRA
jgi:N utilization substance protein A